MLSGKKLFYYKNPKAAFSARPFLLSSLAVVVHEVSKTGVRVSEAGARLHMDAGPEARRRSGPGCGLAQRSAPAAA